MTETRETYTARELMDLDNRSVEEVEAEHVETFFSKRKSVMDTVEEEAYRRGYYQGWRVGAGNYGNLRENEFAAYERLLFKWYKGDASVFETPPV